MKKVVTFGEIMLRLSPPGFERFVICLSDEMTMLGRVRDFHAAY